MSNKKDLLGSAMASLRRSKEEILALSTSPALGGVDGFAAALPNPADRRCLVNALSGIEDAAFEIGEVIANI